MEGFLSSLAKADFSATTQNQAFNALLFLCRECLKVDLKNINALRAKRPQMVRVCPNRKDTDALLQNVTDFSGYPTRLIVHLIYGAGLRVNEPLNLRTKDVDLDAGVLTLRGAKGGKDRRVPIPPTLLQALAEQLKVARRVWEGDQDRKIPVPLPGRLAKKYPSAPFSWAWAWVFPAHGTCMDPRAGSICRWRCHEANVQRTVKAAVRRLGLDETITPHNLRHAYATHTLDAGANIRALQSALGHKNLETTMIYTHAEGLDVRSPLALPWMPAPEARNVIALPPQTPERNRHAASR